MKARQALAVSIIRWGARLRTPSGSPSPQTSGGRIDLWRSSMLSQTAWPTRWAETEKADRPLAARMSQRDLTYFGSSRAFSTSKWSPQQASSMPSKPKDLALAQMVSKGRSAHWPVNNVTGRDIEKPPGEDGPISWRGERSGARGLTDDRESK